MPSARTEVWIFEAGASERPISPDAPRVRRIDILGGLIHEYEPVAA